MRNRHVPSVEKRLKSKSSENKDNMDTKNDYIEILHYNNMYLTCCEVNLHNLESQLFTYDTPRNVSNKKQQLQICPDD